MYIYNEFWSCSRLFNRFSPKISKGIGQVANIARNVGQEVQNVRNIGSTVNSMSGGRIGSTPFGQRCKKLLIKLKVAQIS